MTRRLVSSATTVALMFGLLMCPTLVLASSHMDAPLITLDDAANTTDVYAFLSQHNGMKHLTTALAVYPFEEPGIGPNKFNFDDNVRYEIYLLTGNDVRTGRTSLTYRFTFDTTYQNPNTILQSYLGVVEDIGDANQNLVTALPGEQAGLPGTAACGEHGPRKLNGSAEQPRCGDSLLQSGKRRRESRARWCRLCQFSRPIHRECDR